eukprot:3546591-Amphidinium_carterae.1
MAVLSMRLQVKLLNEDVIANVGYVHRVDHNATFSKGLLYGLIATSAKGDASEPLHHTKQNAVCTARRRNPAHMT